MYRQALVLSAAFLAAVLSAVSAAAQNAALDPLIARHAAANGLPESLVRRVIWRESRYNPRVVSKGNYGLMQIRLGTARAMGYRGDAEGLLDAHTNMTYAVRYLAGAYRAAGGNHDRAVALYARGYYHEAKRLGFSPYAPAAAAAAPSSAASSAYARAGESSAARRRGEPAQADNIRPAQPRTDATEPPAN